MAKQTIAEVMIPNPITCMVDAEFQEAARLMRDRDIGDVVVVDDQRVRGIVTDRDLVVRGLASGFAPSTHLGDVLTEGVITVDAGETIGRAAEIMRERAVRRLPVLDGDVLVGVVSLGDLAIAGDPKSVLADISAAPGNT
jgi:CBS domain-containing protein